MTEFKPTPRKKRKREELSLKQKTYIGIGIFILLTILTFQVLIPQFSMMQGRKIADRINEVIKDDHFELVSAERNGIQFFSHYQSTRYKDLYISTDMAPDDFTPNRINYLYDKAIAEKPGTMQRFALATDDSLYDQLAPVLGEKLLRVIGTFAPGSAELVELDEAFQLGKLPGYTPTVDIIDAATDENYLKYFGLIEQELNKKNYNVGSINIQFTTDRKNAVTYRWVPMTEGDTLLGLVTQDLATLRQGGRVDHLTVTEEVYFDYPYNHNFTLPAKQ